MLRQNKGEIFFFFFFCLSETVVHTVLSLRSAVERDWGGRKVGGQVGSRDNVVWSIGMVDDGDNCTQRLRCPACDQWGQTVRGTVEA